VVLSATNTGTLSTGNGSITANGGTAVAQAGRNAGNVTLSAGVINLGTGGITASGTAGVGTDQAGGAGGAISLTSSGAITAGALTASGGAGAATNGAGGAAGSITVLNNSTTLGAIVLGALTARTGAAAGTGAGGAAGSISVTNNAAGLALGTGAIDTSGNAGGNGGAVTLASQGGVTTTTISTGGAALAAGTRAGSNAGNITITGVNRSVGVITASGSAANGTNQTGGAAGVVSITGTGTLNTSTITASTGAATGTGAGGAAGSITLSGTTVTAGALTTTGASNGAGGNVSATASTGLLNVTGAITTTGGTALANTAGRSAGTVTLTGNSVTTVGITANGSAGNGTNRAGGNGAAVTVTGSGGNVSVGAISTIGAIAGTGNANGGNAGSITLDASGGAPLITLNGNLTATGGNGVGTGTAGSGGQVWVKDAVTQTANVTVNTIGGTTGGTGGAIRLDGALNEDAMARTLTLTAGTGAVTLGGGAPTSAVTTLSATGGSIALGSVQTKGAQSYAGATSLNGNLMTLGTAGADTVTFNSPVTLTGNSSITTAGGVGDNIAITQTINGEHNLTLNAGASGDVTTTAGIGQTTALGNFSAAGAAVSLGAVRAAGIFGRSTTGNLTVTGVQTATGGGDSVVLVAKQNFVNTFGAGVINPGTGRWLVYSTNPASDTRNGLTANFKQYNATYGDAILGTGNGFVHTVAPVITVSLTGTVSKVYDGNTTATLAAGNYSNSGAIDGDVIVLNNPTSGSYADKNAGTGKTVTVSGVTATASNGATTVYGYQVAGGGTATGNIGDITQRALTVAAAGSNKVYDGNTTATVSLTDNRVAGDTLTASNTAANFADKNAGLAKAVSVTGISISGTDAANYSFNTTASTSADITQRALTVAAAGSNKVYDGNTTATVSLTDNRVAGDSLTASNTAANFADKNAGLAKAVSVTGISISGADAANYTANTTAATTANITPASIANVTGITANTKIADGNTTASLNTGAAGFTGMLGGDVLNVAAATGNFDTAAPGRGKPVAVTGIALGGVDAGNYLLANNTASTEATIVDAAGQGGAFRPALAPATGLSSAAPTPVSAGLSAAAMNALLESAPTAAGSCADSAAACAAGDSVVLMQILREPADQRPGIVAVTIASEQVAGGAGFRFALPRRLMALAGQAPVEATTLSGKPLPAWLRFDDASGEFTVTGLPVRALPQQLRVGLGSRSVVLTVSEGDVASPGLRSAEAKPSLRGG
uniref:beta strand repeat-containing protein n=1 Tax=Polaromonas sp. TaxID=1869339 RepID=UPI00180B3F3B